MKVSRVRLALVFIIALGILLPRPQAQAQHNATLYFMRDLPLVNTLNPAFQPEAGSVYIGFPVLSSLYINAGITARGVSINNLMNGQPKLREIAEHVSAFEGGHGNVEVNLLNLGILVRDMYFTFDVTTKANADASVPGSLLQMAWYGNAPSLGKAISLEGLGGQSTVVTEFALGFSKEIVRDKITVGGKFKYLLGHVYTEAYLGSNSFVYTDPESWNITVGVAPEIYMAGLPVKVPRGVFDAQTSKIEMGSYSPTVAGGGCGFDLGFEIKGERLTTSGSLTNLGLISWKNTDHIEADGGYSINTFRGIDANSGNIVEQLKDSLINSIKFHGYTTTPLYRWTDPTMSFAVSYMLHPNFSAGALVAMTISKYNNYPLLALSLNTQKFPINGSLSYSYSNSHNIGAGILFGRRGAQFHLICDNTLAANYRSARQTNIRMGFNLLLGEPKNTSERKKTWELLNPTSDEKPKEKKVWAPLNSSSSGTTKTPVNKAPLNSASQESSSKRSSSQGTLSSPAGQEPQKPKTKNKKPLN